MDGAAAPIAKLLASPHRPTRDAAVRNLSAWLSSQPAASVSDDHLLRAWKSLFYCVWHCDGAAAQSALAVRLAAVLPALPPPFSARFLAAAFTTLRREWPGIDLLRLDKFYLLLRRLLGYALLLLDAHFWDRDVSAQFTAILSEKALLSADNYVAAQGVAYHVADVFLDELRDFLPLSLKSLEILLTPFLTVLEKSQDRVLVKKVSSNVFERLLEGGSKLLNALRDGVGAEVSEEVEKFGKIGLSLGLSKKFFESASNPETIQGNRNVLFGLHEGFVKLEKDLEVSGIEISLPELESRSSEVGGGIIVENVGQSDGKVVIGGTGSDEKPCAKRKEEEVSVTEDSEDGESTFGHDGRILDSTKKKKKFKKTLNDMNKKSKTETKKRKKAKECGVEKGESDVGSDMNNLGLFTANPVAKLITETGIVVNNEESVNGEVKEADCSDNFDEITSGVQKIFEKVAAEEGMGNGGTNSSAGQTTPLITIRKKRKRSMSYNRKTEVSLIDASDSMSTNMKVEVYSIDVSDSMSSNRNAEVSSICAGEESMSGKSEEKSAKKVRFSMKNNLVWKPQTPLPPQSLRLPPSAMPRGSALKKGVPPGPVRETPVIVRKAKVKKALKRRKTASPSIKRLQKLQSLSVN